MLNADSSPAPWTPAQRRWFWLGLAAGLGWSAFIMLSSTGWSLDDELSHYMRSRSVWQNPALLLDAWTRPGRNLLHVLPAHFGLAAARLWTLGLAALGVVLATRLALRLGLRRAWLVPLLLCFQPWFVELSWGVLTQTPFLLVLVAGILCLVERRLVLSGFCFGFLPLIRHEGIALTALWAAAMVVEKILRRAPSWPRVIAALLAAALPQAAYNLASWLWLGELPLRVFLSAKPTEIYGHGTLWHFIPISILPAGIFTLILAGIGLPALVRLWRTAWPLAFYPAYFALHSVIYWKGLFASGGYYHFLMPTAPGLAIAALCGANGLLDRSRLAGRMLLGGCVAQGLLMLHLWRHGRPEITLSRDPIHYAIDDALAWQKQNRPAALTVCHHIYAAFREDWIETAARRQLDADNPAQLPPGTIVIWEEKYSDLTGLPLAELRDPAWQARARFGDGSVRVFEKIR